VAITVDRDAERSWFRVRADEEISIDQILELLRTARASTATQMWPMLCDLRGATSRLTPGDVDAAADVVRRALQITGPRAHVAIAADDDSLYRWMLAYETRCAALGVRTIRVFRRLPDAERWLEIVSAARNLR
jgi:hypothetical protein